MILAHVSPFLIIGFWVVLFVALVFASVGIALVFSSRRVWAARSATVAMILGIFVGYFAIGDGALRGPGWFTVVAALPCLLALAVFARLFMNRQ